MLATGASEWQAARLMGEGQSRLTERQRAILDFEGSWWKVAARKEQLVRERFHTSPENYADELEPLIENQDAFDYHPFVIQKLRREAQPKLRRTIRTNDSRKEGLK